jgi:hypothetical protein
MNSQTYNSLIQDLEAISSEIFGISEPDCNFDDETPECPDFIGGSFDSVWQDR